jgi:glycosyltransferase involved in cell wall biosynthesis
MFLSSGRPTILPYANVGKRMADNDMYLHLFDGSVEEIVAKVMALADEKERRRIGLSGRAFAREHFNWDKSAARVLEFVSRSLQ